MPKKTTEPTTEELKLRLRDLYLAVQSGKGLYTQKALARATLVRAGLMPKEES